MHGDLQVVGRRFDGESLLRKKRFIWLDLVLTFLLAG